MIKTWRDVMARNDEQAEAYAARFDGWSSDEDVADRAAYYGIDN